VIELIEPKWLMFDLGGVLADYVGGSRMRQWMRNPVEQEEFNRRWLFSPSVRALESGQIEFPVFAEKIISELDLAVDHNTFIREFPRFVTGYFPGAESLLRSLSVRFKLAMLSNTNAPQWAELCRISSADKLLDRVFLSFRMGLLKPDPEVFRHVVKELGCAPQQIIFFDDNAYNVQGAAEGGIRAVQVKSFENMREIIAQMNLL
jgi:putative hydrolase of the HAD superfamily